MKDEEIIDNYILAASTTIQVSRSLAGQDLSEVWPPSWAVHVPLHGSSVLHGLLHGELVLLYVYPTLTQSGWVRFAWGATG